MEPQLRGGELYKYQVRERGLKMGKSTHDVEADKKALKKKLKKTNLRVRITKETSILDFIARTQIML